MRCTRGARLALILLLACAPAAWADPPLGPGRPCKTVDQVLAAISFENSFPLPVETKACEKLCKRGRATCAKHVNRAVTCARKSIEDSTSFAIKVSCDGEHGAALKACRKSLEDPKKDALGDLDGERAAGLDACETKANDCAGECGNAAP